MQPRQGKNMKRVVISVSLAALALGAMGVTSAQGVQEVVVTGTQTKAAGAIDFVVSFKNKGNVHVVPEGRVVIKSLAGKEAEKVIGEVEFDEVMGAVLPDGVRRLRAQYPTGLVPGEYAAEVILTYGGETPATKVHKFSVW